MQLDISSDKTHRKVLSKKKSVGRERESSQLFFSSINFFRRRERLTGNMIMTDIVKEKPAHAS